MRFGKYTIKEVHFRWIGIFVVAYLMSFIHPKDEGETELHKYFISLIYTTLYWNGAFLAFIYFRKKYPLIRQTPRRLFATFLVLAFYMVFMDPFLCAFFNSTQLEESLQLDNLLMKGAINMAVGIFIGSFYENAYFFEQWKKTIVMNEALKNQQVRTQFEVLQNQMSPHFLFNSLNTLTALIAEDATIAIAFTEKLSEVYRYILQTKEKEVVDLSEELDFVKNYVFLLQIRYPSNLKVTYDIPEKFRSNSIAPLTIQMLVENAIKHNAISKANPLHIYIYMENEKSIVVKNNLQKKKTIEKSTKTGLENIRKRYAYFGNKNISVLTYADNFSVSVPLLSVTSEKDDFKYAKQEVTEVMNYRGNNIAP